MGIPSDFNEFEHLQRVYRVAMNEIVREHFSEVPDIDDDLDLSISTHALKHACKHKDDDSALETAMRSDLFRWILNQTTPQHIYGIPVSDYHALHEFLPQVQLHFLESKEDAKSAKRARKVMRVSFRLTTETAETITRTDIQTLQTAINRAFPASYRFRTGRLKGFYEDKAKGYRMIIPPYSVPEGKELITKVLDIRNHTPEWDKLSISSKQDKSWEKREYIKILGERVKKPNQRPIAYVKLRQAELKLWGRSRDEVLVYRNVD